MHPAPPFFAVLSCTNAQHHACFNTAHAKSGSQPCSLPPSNPVRPLGEPSVQLLNLLGCVQGCGQGCRPGVSTVLSRLLPLMQGDASRVARRCNQGHPAPRCAAGSEREPSGRRDAPPLHDALGLKVEPHCRSLQECMDCAAGEAKLVQGRQYIPLEEVPAACAPGAVPAGIPPTSGAGPCPICPFDSPAPVTLPRSCRPSTSFWLGCMPTPSPGAAWSACCWRRRTPRASAACAAGTWQLGFSGSSFQRGGVCLNAEVEDECSRLESRLHCLADAAHREREVSRPAADVRTVCYHIVMASFMPGRLQTLLPACRPPCLRRCMSTRWASCFTTSWHSRPR